MTTYYLRFVTGVPVMEKRFKQNKLYKIYKKETNTFVPWFVKKHKNKVAPSPKEISSS
jgi:steroid 5-alpha reductase family enzyme